MRETTKMIDIFKDVKVGDELYSIEDGWGTVVGVSADGSYPLAIQFRDKVISFTRGGKRWACSKNPTLFWDKIEFEIPKKPLPNLKVDTRVLVWDSKEETKKKRYFKEFSKDGKIICFVRGATSWTASNAVEWEYWEIAE